MTSRVEKGITVDVRVSMAYNQWTRFKDFIDPSYDPLRR
jgi:hypothetical protein